MSRFLPADHSKGDERTIGGYAAVHARPAAFEGRDGYSYSVEILADESDDAAGPFGAFFLFVQWKRFGEQAVEGHLESPFLAHGSDAAAAMAALGTMTVEEVQRHLDTLIAEREQAVREQAE
ncbi:MAG: hypothetical protein K8S21_04075 [Gemmatimonadetes bacterium]|nr:hypothetical protein [Gemmatimonadota bacterium]